MMIFNYVGNNTSTVNLDVLCACGLRSGRRGGAGASFDQYATRRSFGKTPPASELPIPFFFFFSNEKLFFGRVIPYKKVAD